MAGKSPSIEQTVCRLMDGAAFPHDIVDEAAAQEYGGDTRNLGVFLFTVL